MNRPLIAIVTLLLAAAVFIGVNIAAGPALRDLRLDLTEGRLYTLSQGSLNIARSVKEPIRLSLFYSAKAANDLPQLMAHAQRVREILDEYARASGGNIRLEIINPEPFSNAEDRAVQAGLVGVPTGRGPDRFYFGLVGTNAVDQRQVIPLFDPTKEGFLEYDISRLIYLLSDQPKRAVGMMTWLPVDGVPANPQLGMRDNTPPWTFAAQLRDYFDVRSIPNTATDIPTDVGVLIVIHPKSISKPTEYALDQFVLRGGRLLVFADPLCDADIPPGVNPMQAMGLPRSSTLPTLFPHWGLTFEPDKVAGDRRAALRVNVGSPQRPEEAPFLPWLGLTPPNFDKDDPAVGQMQNINMITAGILRHDPKAGTAFAPLIRTTTESQSLDARMLAFPDPKGLLASFKPSGDQLVLAARVGNITRTAFPGGPPKDQADAAPAAGPGHLEAAKEPGSVTVFADADMLTDRFWVQVDRMFGFRNKIADNGDLVIALVDQLAGSTDLLTLRGRGRSSRPFERVQQIQAAAEQEYFNKERELQDRLRETERKLSDLQRQRPDGQNAVVLTPEQQKEIESFRAQMLDTRRELRDVQFSMRRDVDALGTRLKALNIALVPILLAVFALGLAAFRASRRRSAWRSAA
ncbi:MAG: Gldg family protein [Phycisphaerales bacterium]|nr:Gldg family protein [Phycisphaerales bacterium]